MSVISHLKRMSTNLYKHFIKLPTYTLGRRKLEDPSMAIRKVDLSTQNHHECDEIRIKYLHAKEELETMIDQYTKDLNSKK